MDDQPEDTPGIRHAIKRLSSVLSRKASTATTTLRRSKSATFNSIISLPNKDAVPPRSALRGSRTRGIQERRVSFYDSLPCLDYGPSLTDLVAYSTESTERRGELLLPAIAADDRIADDQLREAQSDKEQSVVNLGDLQPVNRHDSSVEPVSLPPTSSVPRSKTPGSLSRNDERRRSCMDFTKAMMEENARSHSHMRSLSSLADKAARGQSPRPANRENAVTSSQETDSQHSSPRAHEHIAKANHLDNISQAYKAHIDRSLRSMQGADERGSAYVHGSLIEIQEALDQALAETTTDAEADDSDARDDKPDDAFSFDMPYDSAQPSAEAVNFTKTTHRQASAGLHDLGSYDQSDEDFIFDPALMPLPLRIRPRHPQRDSKVAR